MRKASIKNLADANQLSYKKPRRIIEKWFEERDIEIQSPPTIYPEYPSGFMAVLAAYDKVWILRSEYGWLRILDIQHVRGFMPNGTLIFESPPDHIVLSESKTLERRLRKK